MTSDDRDVGGQAPTGPTRATDPPTDPSRRQFFRVFGRQTVAGAGNVIGAADALRRGGTTAAGELLGLGFGSPQANAARLESRLADAAPTVPVERAARFSSPYAYSDEAILLLDQRLLPDERATVTCREPSEVAAALRAGVMAGGPILAEVAAHTLVLADAAAEAAGYAPDRRRAAFATAADTLVGVRPSIRAIRWAVERMRAAVAAGEPLRPAADAIAMELALDHARLGRLGAPALAARRGQGTINLLFHGEMGPLSCGLVGTGFAIVRSLLDAGREVHVWLTEGGPWLRGGVLSAHQLAQLDVPHTVVSDAAIDWLLRNRPVDCAVVRLDTVFASGDALAPIGAAAVARLARAANVPVFGCAATSAIDVATDTAVRLPPEIAPPGTPPRLTPLADALPASLIDAFVTEEGVLEAPYDTALVRAVEQRAARRLAEQHATAAV